MLIIRNPLLLLEIVTQAYVLLMVYFHHKLKKNDVNANRTI